jgi:hypothetical protein
VSGAGAAAAAHADIVKLTNGRIMNVEMAHFDGDMVILDMRGGGEIRAPRNMIAELLPDEVPYARSVAIEALAASPMATAAPMSVDAIRALVRRIAAKVGLDERLAHAVVKVESNYQMLAVSPRGAMGLMQIMPATAKTYGVVDPFNPEQNIEAGIRFPEGSAEPYGGTRAGCWRPTTRARARSPSTAGCRPTARRRCTSRRS